MKAVDHLAPLALNRGRTPAAKRARSERDAAIIALAQQGLPPAEIAERFTLMSSHNVARILHDARKEGVEIPKFNSSGEVSARPRAATPSPRRPRRRPTVSVSLPACLLEALEPAARVRGTVPAAIVRWLLEAVTEERGLVDAVLDDGVRSPGVDPR